MGVRHSRTGDKYSFDCDTLEEAQRLRSLLMEYGTWLTKNSWVGEPKKRGTGDAHEVSFHAKSVIEYLRNEGF